MNPKKLKIIIAGMAICIAFLAYKFNEANSDLKKYKEYIDISDNYKIDGGSSDLMTKIKIPIIIAIISLLVNNIKVDELLLGVSFFNSEGSVNMFGLLLKALMVGGIFYVVNTYILNN